MNVRTPICVLLAGAMSAAFAFRSTLAQETIRTPLVQENRPFTPVTQEMLENPPPEDWLMFGRTYDQQRFSPLTQIDRTNAHRLRFVWSRGFDQGYNETVPQVHDGVMYTVASGGKVQALDATTGDLLWEYARDVGPAAAQARSKSLALYQDLVIFTAPDSFTVGLDARTGEQRWEARNDGRNNSSGPLVVEGNVISAGACGGTVEGNPNRTGCYVAGHDALTGKEQWRFYTTAGPDDPGDASWYGVPPARRRASPWGNPGSYDPVRKLLYWGVANPYPDARLSRHRDVSILPLVPPVDLYSNSTVALDPTTGELEWYFQHLPGDDWDADHTHGRMLVRARFNPDPKFVKWINPDIPRGQEVDMVLTAPEGGGLWALGRDGTFLWAMPFPYDVPEFPIEKVDLKTGAPHLNPALMFQKPTDRRIVCFYNTTSWWASAYHPGTNSMYIPYVDNCQDTTARRGWQVIPRPGIDMEKWAGIAKVNMSTGEIQRFDEGSMPSTEGVLATAGGLIFHGDLSRRFRAFDAETGAMLWETILGSNPSGNSMTYAVNGRQYVAVGTGNNMNALTGRGKDPGGPDWVPSQNGGGFLGQVAEQVPGITKSTVPSGHNAMYVFALDDER